ncbi:unnamed protein product, partial [Ectocarpus sp. 12 AP-2014]
MSTHAVVGGLAVDLVSSLQCRDEAICLVFAGRGGGRTHVLHALAVRPRVLEMTEHCSHRTNHRWPTIPSYFVEGGYKVCFHVLHTILSRRGGGGSAISYRTPAIFGSGITQ